MSNIKDKYDLICAISNLGFLTVCFSLCDKNWWVVGKCADEKQMKTPLKPRK